MPWAAYPWQLLGEGQLSAGRTSDARMSLREAIEQDPEQWSAWYDLAVVSLGRAREAALARAERLNPLGPEVVELRQLIRTDS
jgi:Flp pilus assembly protein TadD